MSLIDRANAQVRDHITAAAGDDIFFRRTDVRVMLDPISGAILGVMRWPRREAQDWALWIEQWPVLHLFISELCADLVGAVPLRELLRISPPHAEQSPPTWCYSARTNAALGRSSTCSSARTPRSATAGSPLRASSSTRGAMGDVLVITHDAAVARWADTIARVAGPAGTTLWLRPVVVCLTLAEMKALLAAGSAELAVVASWAVHDQTGQRAKAVVREAVKTINAAPDPSLRHEMLRAMIGMLGDTLAREIEDLLMTPLNIKDSPVYTRIVTTLEARGEARGEARLLLRTLEQRGLAVDEATRARVTACTDTAVLERWFDRALTATSLDEVFADAP